MTTKTLSPIAAPLTDEWHAARKTGFGASEASGVCGLSGYGQPLKIYLEKTGQIEPEDENDAMRLGKLLESVIESEFVRRTGIKVIESPMGLYRSADNPFMLATPDADLETRDLGEWKAMNFRRAAELGEQDSDNLPDDWVCQCQQQMHVMDRQRVHVAVLIDGRTLKTYQVERNDRLIEGIIEAERELWQRIENRDPPEPNWEHSRTPQLIREMYGIVEAGDAIELSEEAARWWQCRKALMETIRENKEEADVLKSQVMHEIGNAPGGILPGTGKMVRRKEMTRKGYTVEEKYLIDVREVKVPKHII